MGTYPGHTLWLRSDWRCRVFPKRPIHATLQYTNSNLNRRLPLPQPTNFPALYLPETHPTSQIRHPLHGGELDIWAFGIVAVEDTTWRHSPHSTGSVLNVASTENLLYHLLTRKRRRSFCHTKHVVKIDYRTSCSKSTWSDAIVDGTLLPWRNVIAI